MSASLGKSILWMLESDLTSLKNPVSTKMLSLGVLLSSLVVINMLFKFLSFSFSSLLSSKVCCLFQEGQSSSVNFLKKKRWQLNEFAVQFLSQEYYHTKSTIYFRIFLHKILLHKIGYVVSTFTPIVLTHHPHIEKNNQHFSSKK